MLKTLCTALALLQLTSGQQRIAMRPTPAGGQQWRATEQSEPSIDQQWQLNERLRQQIEQLGVQHAEKTRQNNGQSGQSGGQFPVNQGQLGNSFQGNRGQQGNPTSGIQGQHGNPTSGIQGQSGVQYVEETRQHNGQSGQSGSQFPVNQGQSGNQFPANQGQLGNSFQGNRRQPGNPTSGIQLQPGNPTSGIQGQHGAQYAEKPRPHGGQSGQRGNQPTGTQRQPSIQFSEKQDQPGNPFSGRPKPPSVQQWDPEYGRQQVPGSREANKHTKPTGGRQPEFGGWPKPTASSQRETNVWPRLTAIQDEEHPFCCRDSLSGAINDFGFALAKRLPATVNENLFFSPLSISVALAKVYLGAAGETARQLDRVLGFSDHDLQPSEVHVNFRKLLSGLETRSNDFILMVANGLFLQEKYEVDRDYLTKLNMHYKAAWAYLNFKEPVVAAKHLNNWVSNATRGAIPKLFDGPMNPMARLVLINAVYFKAPWKKQFPRKSSYEGSFYKSDRTNKTVNLMLIQDEKFRFFEDENLGYKFLELPYKGDRMAMLLALPRRSNAPADLDMTTGLLCRVNASMRTTEMQSVVLPSFKLEYAAPLKDPITVMGAGNLFKPGIADLSGIRSQKDLNVDSMMHKAVLDVNEEGSEAAAATGVVMVTLSLSHPTFVANHPFLLYIVDKSSGLVMFSGRVANP